MPWLKGTDGKPGSLCSISGGSVAGYNMTACTDGLLCAPFKSGKLFGTGVGFCNLTAPGQSVSLPFNKCAGCQLGSRWLWASRYLIPPSC